MTAPALARATSFGRLYARPDTDATLLADVPAALSAGLLMPSVTNVIDTLGKPFLASWQAREAGAAAVEVARTHPGLIEAKPAQAKAWIAGAADRKANAAAALGDEVHNIVEARILGRPHAVSDAAAPFVAAWETFVADTGIEFVHVEATCFGAVPDAVTGEQLGYAGTADFIGRLDGRLVVGDWKCAVPGTPVLMADGSERAVEELKVGDLLTSYDEATRSITIAPVEYVGENGVHPTVVVVMAGGRELEVTLDHPILIARNDGDSEWAKDRKWMKAGDVRPGDYAVAALEAPGIPDFPMEYNEAYLIGALVGDGTLGRTSNPKFSNKDTSIVEGVSSLITEYFGGRLVSYNQPSCDYSIVFKTKHGTIDKGTFRLWLHRHDMRHTAHGKTIPQAVMSGGRDAWLGFLSGYLDTDGSVRATKDRPNVSWTSVSHELLRQTQQLLANIGVVAHLTGRVRDFAGKPRRSYTLQVSSSHGVLLLAGLLRPLGSKRDKLRSVAKRLQSERTTPRGVSAILARNPDLLRVLEVRRSKIARRTIAVTVAGTHTHVTGGIITHNTGKSIHTEAALQCAALAHAKELALVEQVGGADVWRMVDMPEVESALVVHLTRAGYRLWPAVVDGRAWDVFSRLRGVWGFHQENLASREPLLFGPVTGGSSRPGVDVGAA